MAEKEQLKEIIAQSVSSFSFLFEGLSCGNAEKRECVCGSRHRLFIETLGLFLRKYQEETVSGKIIYADVNSPDADSADALNMLFRLVSIQNPFRIQLDDALFDALMRLNPADCFAPEKIRNAANSDTLLGLSVRHACRFANSLAEIFRIYGENLIYAVPGSLPRLIPGFADLHAESSFFCRSRERGIGLELAARLEKNDVFAKARVFRYLEREFVPTELRSIRRPEEFYGYVEAKRTISLHLDTFIQGKHNVPLLISGLPGLGKTQMTISYVLSHPELCLVLPSPEDLQHDLESLTQQLALRKNRKFVIFFDDVDTREINWYAFRTFVGGTFSLPPNLLIVIASNYKFPPNISSRGRGFVFPLFDEIRCQEMIEDLFLSKGMEHVSPDLLSVIAADYVEAFGQKEFDELSPRTLARYLELYLDNPSKRKHLLELSKGEVITRPDSQIFYEQNIRLLRALFGKEAIDEIRDKELSL